MKTIHIIDNIVMNIPDGPLGILLSGGIDSAVLLYFLLKHVETEVHIFSTVYLKNHIHHGKATMNVVSKCAELTNNCNFLHYIQYREKSEYMDMFRIPDLYLEKGIINYLYTGITKDPPDDAMANFVNKSTEGQHRHPSVIRETQIGKYLIPLTNSDKKDIYSIYKKYNLMETLFPVTRSCDPALHSDDINNETAGCGKCWECEERFWGFGQF